MRRWGSLLLCVGFGLLMAGGPKGQPDFSPGKKAETLQDYDAAYVYYQKAVKANPNNAAYRIKLNSTPVEASQQHIKMEVEFRKKGDLQAHAANFQRRK